jgi:hypothetical protein
MGRGNLGPDREDDASSPMENAPQSAERRSGVGEVVDNEIRDGRVEDTVTDPVKIRQSSIQDHGVSVSGSGGQGPHSGVGIAGCHRQIPVDRGPCQAPVTAPDI